MQPVEIAKQLGKALADSESFKNFQKAKRNLEEHEAARVMLEDFRKKQWEFEKKRLNGDKLLEPLQEELRKLAEIIGLNPYIREYLMAELAFTKIMTEVQQEIAKAVDLKLPEELERGMNNE